jgi:lactococcin 972 family bacteriocin
VKSGIIHSWKNAVDSNSLPGHDLDCPIKTMVNGESFMKRNVVKATLASAALICAAAAPAMAITVDVGGGKWSYDRGANSAWSNYKHENNRHASSVKIGSTVFRSGCTAKGQWSLASGSLNGGAVSYYYDPSC